MCVSWLSLKLMIVANGWKVWFVSLSLNTMVSPIKHSWKLMIHLDTIPYVEKFFRVSCKQWRWSLRIPCMSQFRWFICKALEATFAQVVIQAWWERRSKTLLNCSFTSLSLVNKLFSICNTCKKTVIGSVHGKVYGGGLALALQCHVTFANSTTLFSYGNLSWGVSGLFGSTHLFQNMFGRSVAMEHYLTDAIVDAQKALDIGIANALVHHVDKVAAFAT